jgi:hypothetical protein
MTEEAGWAEEEVEELIYMTHPAQTQVYSVSSSFVAFGNPRVSFLK